MELFNQIERAYYKIIIAFDYFFGTHSLRVSERRQIILKRHLEVARINESMALGQRDSYAEKVGGLKTALERVSDSRGKLEVYCQELETAEAQTAEERDILRRSYLASIIQGVHAHKQIGGLRKYTARARARVTELENAVQNTFISLFELPRFNRIPIIVSKKSGKVFYQSPASIERDGSLQGRNLEKIGIGCSKPLEIQGIIINERRYNCWVFPLQGNRSADFSVIYPIPATITQGVKNRFSGIPKELRAMLNQIRTEMAILNEELSNPQNPRPQNPNS